MEIRSCEAYVVGRMLALEDECEELREKVAGLEEKLAVAEAVRDQYVDMYIEEGRRRRKLQDEAIKRDGIAGEVV